METNNRDQQIIHKIDIARMRDYFAHRYGAMDYDMTWNTSLSDVQMLKSYLEKRVENGVA
ncbi:hypothetical protein J6Y50_09190 [bacterium]|nr:hypothetical protein [bacterium]